MKINVNGKDMRKYSVTMTPIQIASNVIEKLQEENRISLETLHKSQNNIKYLQQQLLEKEQLIKLLEERLRCGSNSFLEMSNRQKEITIKHLELQIKKLLKENKELEDQINFVKSDICPRCETKYVLDSIEDKKSTNNISVKKFTVKNIPPKTAYDENRVKMLERIVAHKDKRIQHLSKEVQRLSHSEKELTKKIYRLTKLLPVSQMPSEILTDSLLKEIQSLESQLQDYGVDNTSSNFHKLSLKGTAFQSPNNNYSPEKLDGARSTHKDLVDTDLTNAQSENVTLVSTLNKLFHDVSQLKQLFASENEKLYQNITKNSLKNDVLKMKWKEIINRVNDIAESIQNILKVDPAAKNYESSHEKEEVIQKLQERLRNSVELINQYEDENTSLRENLQKLNEQLLQEQQNLQASESKIKQMLEENVSKPYCSNSEVNEVQCLKGMLNKKQQELDETKCHLTTCLSLIKELQKSSNEVPNYMNQGSNFASKLNCREKVHEANINSNDKYSTARNLEIAEKRIKTCETIIKGLQSTIHNLEDENSKLESDLHMANMNKILYDSNNNHYVALKAKLQEAEEKLNFDQNINKELKSENDALKEENSLLKSELESLKCKNAFLEEIGQEKSSLQSKLQISEQKIRTIENKLTESQISLQKIKNENAELHTDLKASESKNTIAQEYKDDELALRNELILKDDEIQKLKESVHAFECKAYEVNHYRKALRQEIEKLCDVLLENSEDSKTSVNRKAIYNAALIRSAQALLRLDADCNVQPDCTEKLGALEEMKHQVSVYLTEVARINELLTIKEKQKEELLREYLDLDSQIDITGLSSHDMNLQREVGCSGVRSFPVTTSLPLSGESDANISSDSSAYSSDKSVQTDSSVYLHGNLTCSESDAALKAIEKELESSKSVTTYLLSKCSQLEDLITKERTEFAKQHRQSESHEDTIKDLRNQLNTKNNSTKRLNSLIEMMRSKECSDDITMEQLKSEIQWLANENQKVFEKVANTQSELSRCKEENSRIQNDIDNLKRQLINEKYEHAKVSNELKHLRTQLTYSQSSNLNETRI